jgi:hypothetical protein
MDSSSSDEPIKYAPNRLGIALIAAGMIGLVLSVYAIYAMGHWQGIWVYIAIFAFFFTSIACMHSVLSRILDRIILRQIWALTYSDRAKYFMTDNMGRVMSGEPICTVSEIKTGWGNLTNGVKTAAWKSACVIVASAADDG